MIGAAPGLGVALGSSVKRVMAKAAGEKRTGTMARLLTAAHGTGNAALQAAAHTSCEGYPISDARKRKTRSG